MRDRASNDEDVAERTWSKAWPKQSVYSTSPTKNRSMPLLPSSDSPQAATWYCGKVRLGPSTSSCWRSLGATWRDWDTEGGALADRHSYDGRDHIHGCVPHWAKTSRVRVKGLLEHELTWAYYRMRRHEEHPQRQAVGESLPNDCVGEKMRFGRGCTFKFWRDLRPPFAVKGVKRVDDGMHDDVPASSVNHPDGELHKITYECAIEYFAERLLDDGSDAGTFGIRVYGEAKVRIPNAWPHKRPLHILDWGNPTLNPPDNPLENGNKPKAPLPQQTRQMDEKVKGATKATEGKGKKKKNVKVPELDRMQLGQHASLPRLPKKSRQSDAHKQMDDISNITMDAADRRPRKHRVFTPACGFVTYEG